MAKATLCDRCQQPIEKVALKLYIAPKVNGKTDHANYTGHADIGECCARDALAFAKFQKRRKIGRRSSNAVAASQAGNPSTQERAGRSTPLGRTAAAG